MLLVGVPGGTKASPSVKRCARNSSSSRPAPSAPAWDAFTPSTTRRSSAPACSKSPPIRSPIPTRSAAAKSNSQPAAGSAATASASKPVSGDGPTASGSGMGFPQTAKTRRPPA